MALTLLGVGLGPIIVGGLSDLIAPHLGAEALRYALASTVILYALSALCLLAALPRYRRRISGGPDLPAASAAAAA
jgi:hypothetical protein